MSAGTGSSPGTLTLVSQGPRSAFGCGAWSTWPVVKTPSPTPAAIWPTSPDSPLTSKRSERRSEAHGAKIQTTIECEAEAMLTDKVAPRLRSDPVPVLCVAIDGSGVPTTPAGPEGRPGKSPDGRAHTRKAKLGSLST